MKITTDASFESKTLFLWVVVWVIILVLLTRLFYFQVIRGNDYRILSLNNATRTMTLRSPRGALLDRKGRVISRNRVAFSLVLDAASKVPLGKTLLALNRVLGLGVTKERVREAMRKSSVPGVAVLARDIPIDWMEKVESHHDSMPSVRIEMELRREYPYGKLASQALGYVGLLSAEEAKKRKEREVDPFLQVGKSGLEKTANPLLTGTNGYRTIQVNSMGREVDDPTLKLRLAGRRVEPVPGKNVSLNLDLTLQAILEEAFGTETGSAVFMDPRSGEILAWVSLPSFDPNLFSGSVSEKEWRAVVDDPRHPLLNRPIQGIYPPGSTFKPFVATVGLEEGLLTKNTTFSCPGFWSFGGHVFHCWTAHGSVNLLDALRNSCNVYFYRAGERIGIERLARWGALFGFGKRTGVDLPAEARGILPSPRWKARRELGPWYPGETLPFSIGQGYLSVTPLQLLSFYATLAEGGRRVVPHLAREETPAPAPVPISPETVAVVKEGLWRVVNEGGTGTACAIPGLDVCAKTGTAQVVRASAGRDTMSLEKSRRDHAWFAGFAPRNNPTVAFVVMVEHGGHGGYLGARIARKGLEYLFSGKVPEGFHLSPERGLPPLSTGTEPSPTLQARVRPSGKEAPGGGGARP